jgi:LmbE family N-acetylglucosaminyl deacetylase
LFYAHPDDETIAVGARLGRFANAHLVHVTDGVPHSESVPRAHGFDSISEYRDARQEELHQVLLAAGIPTISRECLEVPDQEVSFQLTWLTRRLLLLLRIHRPEAIFTHPFEGGHPDHDACAFAAHHAVDLLRFRHEPAPLIIESPFYHAGKLGNGMETGTFLLSECETPEIAYPLSPREQQHKRTLLGCFKSQQDILSSFPVDEEHFRIAPAYEFRRPPNFGSVMYDNYSRGVKSNAFCDLAWEAEDALDDEMKAACC